MKYQTFKFSSVQEFLDYLPDEQLDIVIHLRDLIFETLPNVTENLAYNVPFYRLQKRIAFIWPGAIPWGKQTKPGVELGFTLGYLLPENKYLNKGNRKEVHIKTMFTVKDIDVATIRQLLLQSAELDQLKSNQ